MIDQNEPNVVEFADSPGRRLRVQRQSRGLTIERIANQLHLRPEIIDALEQDRYERLPDPVFVMGYLRNYARAVGVNPEPLISAYQSHAGVATTVAPVRSVSPNRPDSGGTRILVRIISLALIAGAIGWVALWWSERAEMAPEEAPSDAVAERAPAAPVETAPRETDDDSRGIAGGTFGGGTVRGNEAASPDLASPSDPASVPSVLSPAPSASLGRAPEGLTQEAPTAPPTTAAAVRTSPLQPTLDASALVPVRPATATDPDAAPAGPARGEQTDVTPGTPRSGDTGETTTGEAEAPAKGVVLEFIGPSWVQVTDATGARLLFGEMQPGTRHELQGQTPFQLTVGRVSNTRMTVDGEPFDLEGQSRGNVARFTFDPGTAE
jgi:cytoskeleton protein RodZ